MSPWPKPTSSRRKAGIPFAPRGEEVERRPRRQRPGVDPGEILQDPVIGFRLERRDRPSAPLAADARRTSRLIAARSKWKPSAARPGPKASATPLPASGRADQLGEHEHQGRGGHVAVAGEHLARRPERALRQLQPLLDRVEDRAAAGMDRPAVDLVRRPSRCRASRARLRPRARAGSGPAPRRTGSSRSRCRRSSTGSARPNPRARRRRGGSSRALAARR